jgi:hypothetical protein
MMWSRSATRAARQTSRNTSLKRSSAKASSPTRRSSQHSMAHKKGLHGELIAACDPPDQHFVRGNFPCRGMLRPRGGRSVRIKATVMAIPYNHAPANQV